ncbi:MAG TPA: universal stress protein [Solirubrobacteraceae bacterium]|nr:universal stress protein [Solirubrobacteraceae bacterium]
MPVKTIVSYDDTANDHDALALGGLLARAGAQLTLAYVRHTSAGADDREAQELLDRGASQLGLGEGSTRSVVHASTGQGLIELAVAEGADLVVFGSDYRTAPGSVQPGTSAQRLLDGGPVAVAIAPAGLRDHPDFAVTRIGVLGEDGAAEATAANLAGALGAETVAGQGKVDLLVIGSRPEVRSGHVLLTALAAYEIDKATFPVLVVARDKPLAFAAG